MTLEQPSLFPVEIAPVVKPKMKTSGKPQWGKYRPTNSVRCDDCFTVLVEQHGAGPVCRGARWRRRTKDSDLLLCYAHAQQRRADDGLSPLKDD